MTQTELPMPDPVFSVLTRRAREHDTPAMVDVHLSSFQGFFLTFLGPKFLRELYVATIADESGIVYVAEADHQIVGFVSGTSEPSGFYHRLLRRRWWRFGLAALGSFLRQPTIAPRLLRAFSRSQENAAKTHYATLMSLAVRPENQGLGIGRGLVQAFLQEAAQHGCRQVDLTTDTDNNEGVNVFYRRLGFTCERNFVTPEGRAMSEYVIDVTRHSASPNTECRRGNA